MKKFATMCVMSCLAASPCWGSVREAAYATSADRLAAQTSLFAGANYHVALDRRTAKARGRGSLGLAGMTRTPTDELKFGQGLQISAGQTGKPTFFIADQDLGQMQKHKANLSGGTTAVIVVAGVVLLAGAVFLATYCDNDCDNARNE